MQVKVASCLLLVFLILVSAAYTGQELTYASAGEVPEENFKLNWKLPVGVLKSIAFSEDGTRTLLSALFDGYCLYDSKGQAIWSLPDPYARYGEFSADGKSILLTDSRSQQGKQKVSLIDANSLHEIWNYTLDRVDYTRLSRGGMRAVIVGAVPLATGGWQKLLVVKDKDGTTLLSLKFGRLGEYLEFDEGSQPAISPDGRYAAIGTWGRDDKDYWLYFVDLDSGRSWNATIGNGVRFVAISANATSVVAANSASTVAGPRSIHLFDNKGNLLWSASPDLFADIEFWESLGVSDSGEYVSAAGRGSVDRGHAVLFNRSGEKLWDFRISSRLVAFATDHGSSRFVAGDSDGAVYFLDQSGELLSRTSLGSSVVSIALGGKPWVVGAVGDGNVAYVMDEQANLMWSHVEIGFEFGLFDVKTSTDGKRIVVGYPHGSAAFDENGKRLLAFNTYLSGAETNPPPSSLSADGRLFVVASTKPIGTYDWKPVLVWFDVDTGRQIRNATLNENEMVESLSMSEDGSLVAVSGSVTDSYTFIYAFDSQGSLLWKHIDERREPYLLVHSKILVSGNGLYVAAARQQSGIFGGGTNNGVVLFDNRGKVLWNYTTSEYVLNIAVSENGEYVGAGSATKIYEFDRYGRLLWSIPSESRIIVTSQTGQKFVAAPYTDQELLLGNSTGAYRQMPISGQVESVAISGNGDISASLTSRDYLTTQTARLLYVVDDRGDLLAKYTFIGPTRVMGGSRVAVSGNDCCIVAALETDGVYYFQRNENKTQTITTSMTSTPAGTGENEMTQTIAVILLVGALALVGSLFVRYRTRAKTGGQS